MIEVCPAQAHGVWANAGSDANINNRAASRTFFTIVSSVRRITSLCAGTSPGAFNSVGTLVGLVGRGFWRSSRGVSLEEKSLPAISAESTKKVIFGYPPPGFLETA